MHDSEARRSRDLSTFPPGWEDELRRVSDAIFGKWDEDGGTKRKPGVLERLRRIEYALIFIGFLLGVKNLGVPTEKLFPLILSFLTHGATVN